MDELRVQLDSACRVNEKVEDLFASGRKWMDFLGDFRTNGNNQSSQSTIT